jgi:hypothetical protein
MTHNLKIPDVFIDDISQQNILVYGNTTLSSLDVSGHSQLLDVSCQHLIVSGNVILNDVSCENLDVSGNTIVSGYVAIGLLSSETPTESLTIKNHNESMTSISILANGEGSNSTIFFGTQHANLITNTKKTAIIAEGKNNYSRADLHFCLQNQSGNTNGDVGLSDSKMVITNDGTLNVTGKVGIGTSTSNTTQTGIDYNLYKGQNGGQQTFQGNLAVFGQVIFRDTGETSTSGGNNNRGGPLLFGNGPTGSLHHMDLFNHGLFYINYYSGIEVRVPSLSSSSDDRIKKDEIDISNATIILLKLNPQKYKKYNDMSCSGDYIIETGLISQEVYYEVPELRHIVTIDNEDSSGNNILPTELTEEEHKNIKNDLSYNELNWGEKSCSIKYNNLIAYLIKGFQEQQEIIEEEKAKVATLETQYNTLQSQYNDLLSRISALENST